MSVVVPTHDTRELTLRCVTALQGSREPLEVLVVDDASSDGTGDALAARFPHVAVLRCPARTGFTRAANSGLARAQGEIVLLLNSDTEVEPGALTALLAAFDADHRLGAAGGLLHYPDGSAQWSGGREPGLFWLAALASGLPRALARWPAYRRWKPVGARAGGRVDWVTGAALAVRRRALAEVGSLDERFRFYAQDLDLCLRLRDAGWGIALLADFRVLHHHGATIGKEAGAAEGRQHAELLWRDLLRWAAKRHGERWARRAALALWLGGTARLLSLRLRDVFAGGSGDRPHRK
ncbi:MAG TPA: glycosyltransferase family 2 protein [Thermoanaerobaculia bacterium]|nr:glycosyltransferase family 2 protein [Thermoanaerobaculia bacterium]